MVCACAGAAANGPSAPNSSARQGRRREKRARRRPGRGSGRERDPVEGAGLRAPARRRAHVMAAGRWPLAAGRWPLAAGRWPLAAGRWPLAAGRWPLAAGRWPLAAGQLYTLVSGAGVKRRLKPLEPGRDSASPGSTDTSSSTADAVLPDTLSVFTIIDGLVFTVFDGLWVRCWDELAGCREAVGASSGYAAPSLRYGPSGDPPPSTRRSAAMAVSGAFGHWPIASPRIAMAFGAAVPVPVPTNA